MVSFERLKRGCELHKLVKLRQRKILTRNNKVKLRYVTGCSLSMLLAAWVGLHNTGVVFSPQSISAVPSYDVASLDAGIEPAAGPTVQAAAKEDDGWAITQSLQNEISGGIRKAALAVKKVTPQTQDLKIGKGDTIAGALGKAGVSDEDAFQAVKAMSKHVDPRQVQAGQIINVQFKPGEGESMNFASMTMEAGPLKTVTVSKGAEAFDVDLKEKEVTAKTYAGYAKIQNSLYGSAERAGIPPQVLADVIRLYSRNIDFQRDIRQGDEIEVMYDGQETADGSYKKYGNIIYANLTIGGKQVPLYRYDDGNRADFYDEQGRTTRKTLLKTPIDGARVSSGFGMRRHPILGYTKMHKGIDFAAPTGTPIYAAGDGTINFAGRKNGYGNFVSVRHSSEIETHYGHMYRFAAGMRRGAHVSQGDVIGYVGMTGRATGPHLHYEVALNGRQVNPRSVDLPTGENLKGKDLDKFKKAINSLRQQYAKMTQDMKVAQADTHAPKSRFN